MEQQALGGFEEISASAPSAAQKSSPRPPIRTSQVNWFRFYKNLLLPSLALGHISCISRELFASQTRITSYPAFVLWLKVAMGWCTWAPGPHGGIAPVPRPESLAHCSDEELEAIRSCLVAFIRSGHAARYLWPEASSEERMRRIESITAVAGLVNT